MTKARDLADGTFSGAFSADSPTLVVDDTNNRVGVGTASPSAALHVYNSGGGIVGLVEAASGYNARMRIQSGNANESFLEFADPDDSDVGEIVYDHSSNSMRFNTNATEAMRIDSSGNLLVGKTSSGGASTGAELRQLGDSWFTRGSGAALHVNRTSSDGDIVVFYKDTTEVGSIGNYSTNLFVGTPNNALVAFGTDRVYPANNVGAARDNAIDLGNTNARFDDIFATNGTIQTSDANEKQDIAELDEAEKRVATAAKGLIRKFRWIDSVAEKGDDARIHVGIIAQDLKAAFEAEGLDPGRYAMFISTTWWEAEEIVPAVEEVLDEEGNVITEAQPEYTRTNTYQTAEEAPVGAVERTRLGVRYNQLLAFIIGAM